MMIQVKRVFISCHSSDRCDLITIYAEPGSAFGMVHWVAKGTAEEYVKQTFPGVPYEIFRFTSDP